ncbi:MAG: nidogen-like domain-containing protein [Acidobacteriota bacterium]
MHRFLSVFLCFLLSSLAGVAAPQALFVFPPLDCGYDHWGAEDGFYTDQLNARRLASEGFNLAAASPRVTDTGDIAVIEDDGSIVMPPNKFDLKNKSLLFTPEQSGYSAHLSDIAFDKNYGERLDDFTGASGAPNFNNGSREVRLEGAQFTFFGAQYDRLFVSTNGYITFSAGSFLARPSPAALATEQPRIAPLWADLDISSKGSIYYNRLADHHLITWNGARQVRYSGASTFQLALHDDGRIAFVYKKIKAHASLVGLSPGGSERAALIDFSAPPVEPFDGPVFESFANDKRLDEPRLARAFYSAHADEFDTLYVWTDFKFDNGTGYAHAFNVRNDISGIGLRIYDQGAIYGSAARLSSILTMGNIIDSWPDDPHAHVVGLNSAISIVCHEQGHRWLSYVKFVEGREVRDDLLGRSREHWSFLLDTRTNAAGSFSSLMEGNAWRNNGVGIFTTIETAVNHFSDLDLYLMGLLPADEVDDLAYLDLDEDLRELIRSRSPVSGFSMSAPQKKISIEKIIRHEGPRTPDFTSSPKSIRVAFVLLVERGKQPSQSTIEKLDRYRREQERYFSIATRRRASLESTLR